MYLLNKDMYASMRVCVCVSERASKMAAGHAKDNGLLPLECLRHVAGVREMSAEICVCLCVGAKLENVTRCMQGKTEEHNKLTLTFK